MTISIVFHNFHSLNRAGAGEGGVEEEFGGRAGVEWSGGPESHSHPALYPPPSASLPGLKTVPAAGGGGKRRRESSAATDKCMESGPQLKNYNYR